MKMLINVIANFIIYVLYLEYKQIILNTIYILLIYFESYIILYFCYFKLNIKKIIKKIKTFLLIIL